MQCEFYDSWDLLPQGCDMLFLEAEKKSIFFSRYWFENLATTALKNNESLLFVCVVEDKIDNTPSFTPQVFALLPLIKCADKHWTSLHHIYTSLFSFLLADKNQSKIVKCLAKGISQLPFASLTLGPVSSNDENISELQLALASYQISCSEFAQFFNWFYPLKGQNFEAYMQSRPSRVRNTIARKQRKLARDHDYEISIYSDEDVLLAMPDHYSVYRSSWKEKEPFEIVMNGFIADFAKQGWIRLAILSIDNTPAASQIWFVAHKKASIFKLAYDEKWKQYSPGSILTKVMMEAVIDTDKVDEIDFLIGNDRYKEDWMSERRQRWKVVFTHQLSPLKNENSVFTWLNNKVKKLVQS